MLESNIGKIIAEGKKYIEASEYQKAIACFDLALSLDSSNPELWHYKGCALRELQRYEEALQCFAKSLEIEPRSATTWHNRGYCLQALEKFEESLPCFDEALKLGMVDDHVYYFRGWSLRSLGRKEEAIASFRQAIELRKDVPLLWTVLAETLIMNAQAKEGIAAIEESLELDPSSQHFAWKLYGDSYRMLGKNNLAIHCYDESLRIKPDFLASLAAKSQALISLKKYLSVIETCKRILEIAPSDCSAMNNIGQAYSRLGDAEESLIWYNKVLETDPKYKASIYNKARALTDLARYTEALACLDILIDLGDDKDPDVLIEKSLVLIELGKPEQALDCLENCLSIRPDDPYAWLNKARALISLARLREALRVADEALSRHPGKSIFWETKGIVLVKLQEYSKALDCFKLAVERGRPSDDTWYYTAFALEKMRNFEEALKNIRCVSQKGRTRQEIRVLTEELEKRAEKRKEKVEDSEG